MRDERHERDNEQSKDRKEGGESLKINENAERSMTTRDRKRKKDMKKKQQER